MTESLVWRNPKEMTDSELREEIKKAINLVDSIKRQQTIAENLRDGLRVELIIRLRMTEND